MYFIKCQYIPISVTQANVIKDKDSLHSTKFYIKPKKSNFKPLQDPGTLSWIRPGPCQGKPSCLGAHWCPESTGCAWKTTQKPRATTRASNRIRPAVISLCKSRSRSCRPSTQRQKKNRSLSENHGWLRWGRSRKDWPRRRSRKDWPRRTRRARRKDGDIELFDCRVNLRALRVLRGFPNCPNAAWLRWGGMLGARITWPEDGTNGSQISSKPSWRLCVSQFRLDRSVGVCGSSNSWPMFFNAKRLRNCMTDEWRMTRQTWTLVNEFSKRLLVPH